MNNLADLVADGRPPTTNGVIRTLSLAMGCVKRVALVGRVPANAQRHKVVLFVISRAARLVQRAHLLRFQLARI